MAQVFSNPSRCYLDDSTICAPPPESSLSTQQIMASSDSEEDDSSEDELTPVEYARQHGLIESYGRPNQPEWFTTPPCEEELLTDLNGSYWTSDLDPEEKWDIDKDTVKFLASVFEMAKPQEMDLSATNRLSDLRMEERMLASDPEIDLLQLKLRQRINIPTSCFQPFELNDEQGESLSWPQEQLHAVADADEWSLSEKLDVDAEIMQYIRLGVEPIDPQWTEIIDDAIQQGLGPQRLPAPLSPPLMPLSPPLSPASPTACEVPFTSTPEDLTANELAELELEIFRNENVSTRTDSRIAEVAPDADGVSMSSPWRLNETASSPAPRRTLSNMRLDTPLISTDFTEYEELDTGIESAQKFSNLEPSLSETDLDDDDLTAFMEEILEPYAMLADNQIKTEELVDIDTTLRVDVPILTAVQTTRPSELSTSIFQKAISSLPEQYRRWSGSSKVERVLPWTPFPLHLGRMSSEESFDESTLSEYMQVFTSQGSIDIESLLYRSDRSVFFGNLESDNDDLDLMSDEQPLSSPALPVVSSEAQTANAVPTMPLAAQVQRQVNPDGTMQALLRKRKLELQNNAQSESKSKQRVTSATKVTVSRTTQTSNSTEEFMSAKGLLAFMHLQGSSVKPTQLLAASVSKAVAQVTQLETGPAYDMAEHKSCSATKSLDLFEGLTASTAPQTVFVSSKLLQNNYLVRQIQKALPNVDLIERGNVIAFHTKLPIDEDAEQADITISPSTGLILTTLQKIKQKPLPGQHNYYGIRERICTVSHRYERLVVLISDYHNNNNDCVSMPLDRSDAAAISSLVSFVARVEGDVEICYVPGGVDALVQWTAAAISLNGVPGGCVPYEETLWERCLRSTGLNAYAAETILSQLSTDGVGREQALAAFVGMSELERIERFATLMGGLRVLQRVSKVIASGWTGKDQQRIQ